MSSKSLKWSCLLLILVAAGFAFYHCLPAQLFQTPYSSVALSREGKLLGAHIAEDEQWRFPPAVNVPERFATSLIAFEDKRFWSHPGVDFAALANALSLNIRKGRVVRGASTLSMQVIRLSQQNPPRTYWNKLLEIFKALRLETRHSKREVLALYASHAPFGGNVVGLEAAAWRYFGRSAQQLSWAESAMLAVLPNSPGLIHLNRSRDTLKAKRDRLLGRLLANKKISQLDHDLAVVEPLPGKPRRLPRLAPHLLETLLFRHKRMQQVILSGPDEDTPEDSTSHDDKLTNMRATSSQTTKTKQPRFHTTLEYKIQSAAIQVAKHHADKLALQGVHNLALMVLDNHSFETLAYVGNAPSDRPSQHGQAIDLIQRPRSTGSTLKPFLFANMIQDGEILPDTLVADTPVRYSGYRPRNFNRDFSGAVPARAALASSLNIPAVNMLSQYGVELFLSSLRRMGLKHMHRTAREYGLPLVLGGGEATLWELTSLYANLAHTAQQSTEKNWRFFKRTSLQTSESNSTKRRNTLSPATAWMTLQALLDVTRPGNAGYWKRFDSTHRIAWKTGTSFGHRDAWAIGTTPRYTVGVWVGNAAGEGRPNMTGLTMAAPIMLDMFNRLPLANRWFKRPDGQMKKIRVCKRDGYLANDQCEAVDYYVPKDTHFSKVTPYHQRIHLASAVVTTSGSAEKKAELLRVHGGCEPPMNMQAANWFVLPADQAFYYQQRHADYNPLPKWREDCAVAAGDVIDQGAISIVYPRQNTQIYIPRDLGNQRSRVVFKALHQDDSAKLFWHLNNTFLGTTSDIHEQEIWIDQGEHLLTVVDESGAQITRRFEVLSQ